MQKRFEDKVVITVGPLVFVHQAQHMAELMQDRAISRTRLNAQAITDRQMAQGGVGAVRRYDLQGIQARIGDEPDAGGRLPGVHGVASLEGGGACAPGVPTGTVLMGGPDGLEQFGREMVGDCRIWPRLRALHDGAGTTYVRRHEKDREKPPHSGLP